MCQWISLPGCESKQIFAISAHLLELNLLSKKNIKSCSANPIQPAAMDNLLLHNFNKFLHDLTGLML